MDVHPTKNGIKIGIDPYPYYIYIYLGSDRTSLVRKFISQVAKVFLDNRFLVFVILYLHMWRNGNAIN